MKRLLDELPPGFELSLLASEAIDAPTDAQRDEARRVGLAALGVAAVGVAAAGLSGAAGAGAGASANVAATGVAAKSAGALLAWKALAAGALVTGIAIGAGTTIALRTRETPPMTENLAARASAPPVLTPPPAKPEEVAPPAPAPAAMPAASISAPPAAAPERGAESTLPSRPVPLAVTAARGATSSDLAAEVGALDVVRVALDRNDFAGALRQLDAYAVTYPNGVLSPEAKALRVEALAKRGDMDEALRLGKQLLDAHPNGPYRARIEKAVGRPIP
jgi:hypothetical protein